MKFRAYLGLIIAMLVWSASFIFTKMGLESLRPMTVVTVRISIATVILYLYAHMMGQLQPLKKKDIFVFLLAGFVQPFAYFMCEVYGLTMVSSTVASVILSTIPLFTPFFAFLILKEHISWNNFLGIIISLIGVLMVIVERGALVITTGGLLLLAGCVVSAILYTVYLRKIPSYYNSVSIVFYIHAISLFFFIPTFLIHDMPEILSDGLFITTEMGTILKSVFALLVLAIFASVMGYVFFAHACRQIGATKSNAFVNLMPGSTATIVWLMGGEVLGTFKIWGIVVVIVGLFLGQASFKMKKKNQLLS